MGKETLQTLAEIKMHVRDKHIAHNKMKTRLKRHFGTVNPPFSQQLAGLPPPLSSPFTQSSNVMQMSPIPSTPSTFDSPSDIPSDQVAETEDSTPDGTSDGVFTQLLSTIINQFVWQGELDEGLEIDVLATPTHKVTSNPPISLEDLFDFNWDYWVSHHQRTNRHSLNEEMEVYSLLDADLLGEEGTDVVIDDTTGEVLTLNAHSTFG